MYARRSGSTADTRITPNITATHINTKQVYKTCASPCIVQREAEEKRARREGGGKQKVVATLTEL